MKQYFLTPITSLAGAHAFLSALSNDGLLFHPEDRPEDVVNHAGAPLFDAAECLALNARISEVYLFDADPCAYCLTL